MAKRESVFLSEAWLNEEKQIRYCVYLRFWGFFDCTYVDISGNIDPQARSTKENEAVQKANGNSDEERGFANQRPNRQAEEMAQALFFRPVKELAEKEGVTEELKEADQMVWVRGMNNICERVIETVYSDVVFV